MRRQAQDWEDVAILPCRSWGCEYCGPRRCAQLKAMAAAGLPNSCLTLTVRNKDAERPVDQYARLHSSWKALAKRILRQFAKPPGQRWKLQTPEGDDYYDVLAYRITSQVKAKQIKRLHYMAFVEATERGTPHLHILLRTKYIPQQWISQQMAELIDSPIVWMEKIKGPKSAIQYVAKYVVKAPARFGKSRRYWTSRFYQIVTKVRPETPVLDRQNSRRVRQPFEDFVLEILRRGTIAVPQERGRLRLYTHKAAWKLFSDGQQWQPCTEIIKASLWLANVRRQTGHERWDHG